MKKSTFIIAEAGVNHNGKIELAKKMIDLAQEAGADAIKFQTFRAENLVSKFAPKAEYQQKNTGNDDSQLAMLKALELSYSDFAELNTYCQDIGIAFMSTPFDLESISFLDQLGMSIFKIPSGEITNLPYLKTIAKLNKKIILSTGMSSLQEVEDAIDLLTGNGAKDISLLHCTTEYPAPLQDVNLKAMNTLKEKFGLEIGYSDHTIGIEIAIAAVAMGATIIEKHFTIDKNMTGPDHKASLNPDELKAMITAIRNIELALGNGLKIPSQSEIKNIDIARKSIVAGCSIKEGDVFTEKNIAIKRPGTGISPMEWDTILGKTAIRNFNEDELIEL